MTERTISRRTFLRASAVTATLTAVPVTTASEHGWTAVESPTDAALYDVVQTADGPYAVGASGVVVERTDEGWRKVLDGGPTGNGNDLYGAGTTDAGGRLWFVGASSAIGEMNVSDNSVVDHSAPNDVTNNFNDVAATGTMGEANVYVGGDSGKIYYSFENGETGTWDEVTPGSGSAINALDFHGVRSGHAVDGNQTVFVTDDGTTYDRLGIEDADYNVYGVDSDDTDAVAVSGGGGSVYDWNGSEWVREDNGDPDLRDVEMAGSDGLAVGGGGAVFRRDEDGWTSESTPTGANLKAVARTRPEIAVGASGTILEH